MKRISAQQSRRNRARRQRKVKARHAKAGHWSPQARPLFTAGPVHYEIGAHPDVTPYGGIGVVHRLVTKLGLPKQIDQRLHLLKVHLPYHESDHVLNLAYNALCGGTRLQDIELRRHDPADMDALGTDLIPDPTTTGDFCRRFAADDVVELMEAINAVRPKLWQGRGQDLLGPVAVLYVVNRPGNVPSHTDAARWIDKAIARLQPHAERICLRGDTDFSLTRHFDRWAQQVDFLFGMDCNATLRRHAEALEEACWQRLQRARRRRRGASYGSRTASTPCACRSTTWSATGPTWSWPRWPGISSRGWR